MWYFVCSNFCTYYACGCMRLNTDEKKLSVLVLLDLSAAFDTVYHDILLDRLEHWVGLSSAVLKWFRSYLTGRKFYLAMDEHSSDTIDLTCDVPQGSILGPILFSLYMLPLGNIIRNRNLNLWGWYPAIYLFKLKWLQSTTWLHASLT